MPEELFSSERAITQSFGNRLQSAGRQTLDLFFPPACQACGANTADRGRLQRGFCHHCETELIADDAPACRGCAAPLPQLEGNKISDPPINCPVCRDQKWKFKETISLGPYRDLLRHLVLKSKGRAGWSTARALGALLANHRYKRFDAYLEESVVVPIPSHWTRRLARGANSPDAVAEGLAERLNLKCRHHLSRIRRTTKQTELAPTRRSANVRSAFRAKNLSKLQGKRILLVDDVFTTGATLSEATRELLRAGAGPVIVVVPAKRIERL